MLVARCFVLLAASVALPTPLLAETGPKPAVEAGATFTSDSDHPDVETGSPATPKAPPSTVPPPGVSGDAKLGTQQNQERATAVGSERSGARRDPAGKKGINPYWEAIRRGDEAALAREFGKAEEAYQVAIGLDPKNPLGHFRKGQILVRSGKLGDADTAYRDAMRLSGSDTTARGAALFALADLEERKADRVAALSAWKAYADHLKADSKAKGYPETPLEREKRLRRYNELVGEMKAVRDRIQLRIKELEEANKRKAAKNPNEGK